MFSSVECNSFMHSFLVSENEVLIELHKKFSALIKHPEMMSDYYQCKTLEFFSEMIKPSQILEIGTYTGLSAVYFANGLRAGGKLYTIEKDTTMVSVISEMITVTSNKDRIIPIIGNFFDVFTTLNEKYDLVFIDGEKSEYVDYFEMIFPFVNPGGYIIVDNIFWQGKAIPPFKKDNDEELHGIIKFNDFIKTYIGVKIIIIPVRDGLAIIKKV